MYDRISYAPIPVVFQEKAREQRLFPRKGRFQSTQEETFSESSRAGEKVVLTSRYEVVNKRRFVNIAVPLVDQVFECLYADGKLFHNIVMG